MWKWRSRFARRLAAIAELRRRGLWRPFLRVFCFATAVPILMRLRLPTLDQWLERRIQTAQASGGDRISQEDLLWCFESARLLGWPLVRRGCLTRGLTLYYFLRRTGAEAVLRFGARVRGGQLTQEVGHCWLEENGQPKWEPRERQPQFLPIFSLPARTPD